MNNKIVVISGGAGFLGQAIATQLKTDGFIVASLYHKSSNQENSYQCDLTNVEEVQNVLSKIQNELGPIYAGIHCAQSCILRQKVTSLNLQTFQNQFAVNLFGGFNFFKSLIELQTKILFGITTAAIEQDTSGNFGGYLSAKFALKGLLTELAQDKNILVYDIAPGFMAGGLNQDLPERLFELLQEKAVTKKLTDPQTVAKKISALCLNPDPSLSGQTIVIDESHAI